MTLQLVSSNTFLRPQVDMAEVELRIASLEASGSKSCKLETLYQKLTGKEPEAEFSPEQRNALKALSVHELYSHRSSLREYLDSTLQR